MVVKYEKMTKRQAKQERLQCKNNVFADDSDNAIYNSLMTKIQNKREKYSGASSKRQQSKIFKLQKAQKNEIKDQYQYSIKSSSISSSKKGSRVCEPKLTPTRITLKAPNVAEKRRRTLQGSDIQGPTKNLNTLIAVFANCDKRKKRNASSKESSSSSDSKSDQLQNEDRESLLKPNAAKS